MSGGEPCCLIRSPAGRVLCAVTGLAITNDRAATMGTLAVSFRINQSPDQPVPGQPPEGTRLPGPTRKDEVQLLTRGPLGGQPLAVCLSRRVITMRIDEVQAIEVEP